MGDAGRYVSDTQTFLKQLENLGKTNMENF